MNAPTFISALLALTAAGCSTPSTHPTPSTHSSIAVSSKYEGQLIRRAGSTVEDIKVYVVQNGKKRWIQNEKWILQHGYKWPDDLKLITHAEFAAIPTADPVL
jgi:hypothetical protein